MFHVRYCYAASTDFHFVMYMQCQANLKNQYKGSIQVSMPYVQWRSEFVEMKD